jgi:hypothetical protein
MMQLPNLFQDLLQRCILSPLNWFESLLANFCCMSC